MGLSEGRTFMVGEASDNGGEVTRVFIPSVKSCNPHSHLNNVPLLFCSTVDTQPVVNYSNAVTIVKEKSIFFCLSSFHLLQPFLQYSVFTPNNIPRSKHAVKCCSLVAAVISCYFLFIRCVCVLERHAFLCLSSEWCWQQN